MLSPLVCPNCGVQELDRLAGHDKAGTFGCRRCKKVIKIAIQTTVVYHVVSLEPTPLLDYEEFMEEWERQHNAKGGEA